MPVYKNPDQTESWRKLASLIPLKERFSFRSALDEKRLDAFRVPMAAGLEYSYAAKLVDESVLSALQSLSDEMELIAKFKELAAGALVNTGEKRRVLHHLLRGELAGSVLENGRNLGDFYKGEMQRVYDVADAVHSGRFLGSTGKNFDTVVQIGIGGSDLGPRALYLALENSASANKSLKMKARFISNVDPDDGSAVVHETSLETSLFVLVSKSGVTQETLANELFVKAALINAGLDPAKHMVAVTSETSPLAHNKAYLDSFYIDDYIGGRYSSSSAVGGVVLSLAFGKDWFKDFLGGAHAADKSALEADIRKNPALLDALIGVWERNFLDFPSTAILPYSQALSRFPAHLQQLDMESNGKRVNRDGDPIDYKSGPVIFGEPGTNGQHSFFQLLHQGTDIIPLQFIGFRESQRGEDVVVDTSTSQTKLKANLVAQIVAFACGKDDHDPNKVFPGMRPSSLIIGDRLDPAALGALLAHFENKVMFQGFTWNLNSFDQEGVQLGKILTKQVLSGMSGSPVLDAYSKMLGISI